MGVRDIRVVNADGESLDLSTHAQDFEDFILSQVCSEHLSWLWVLLIIVQDRRSHYIVCGLELT